MKPAFSDTDLGYKKTLAALDALDGEVIVVKAGVLEDSPDYPDGTSVALVAAVHEYGTDTHEEVAPLRTASDLFGADWLDTAQEQIEEALDNGGELDLAPVGEEMAQDLSDEIITSGLVDTGHYAASIRYKVER